MPRKVSALNAVASAAGKASRNRDSDGVMLPGKRVSFASTIGLAEQVGVLTGFGAPEDDGRWSAGSHCELEIKLRGIEAAAAYDVILDVLPFEMGSHRASVSLSAHEKLAAHTIPLGIGWVQLRVPCEVDVSARPPRMRVQFWVENPTSPSLLGVGDDSRMLGFKLRSAQIEIAAHSQRPTDEREVVPSDSRYVASPAIERRPPLMVRARRWLIDRSVVMAPLRWMRRTSLALGRIEALYSQALEHRLGEVRADVAGVRSHVDSLSSLLQEVVSDVESIRREVSMLALEQRDSVSSVAQLVEQTSKSSASTVLDTLASIEERKVRELTEQASRQALANDAAMKELLGRSLEAHNGHVIKSIQASLEAQERSIIAGVEQRPTLVEAAIAALEQRLLALGAGIRRDVVAAIDEEWRDRRLADIIEGFRGVAGGMREGIERASEQQQAHLSQLNTFIAQRIDQTDESTRQLIESHGRAISSSIDGVDIQGIRTSIAAIEQSVRAMHPEVSAGVVNALIARWGDHGLTGGLEKYDAALGRVEMRAAEILESHKEGLSMLGSLIEQKFDRNEQSSLAALQSVVAEGVARQINEEVPLIISLHQKMDALVNHHHRPPLFVRGASGWIVRSQLGYFSCSLDDEMLVMYLAEYGELEPGLRKLIVSLLRDGDVFADVGANIGLHTVAAARVVGADGRVFAVEAAPATVDHLQRSITLSGVTANVSVLPFAAGARVERDRVMHLSSTSGHSSLFPLADEIGQASVAVSTLDELIEGPVDLVKIDVEGAELDVVLGMSRLLSNPEIAVIVEFAPSHLVRAGTQLRDWTELITRNGFEIFRVDDVSGACTSVGDIEALAEVFSVNLLLTRPNTRIWQTVTAHGG